MSNLSIRSDTTKFEHVLDQLVQLTHADPYNPYKDVQWPTSIEGPWIAREFVSTFGTDIEDQLDEATLKELNKWE